MGKSKFTFETKVKACKEYLSGLKPASQIAAEIGAGKNGDQIVRKWAKLFKLHGTKALKPKTHNSSYTKEFKEQIVLLYLSGKYSAKELATKYNISHDSTVRFWIKQYNSHTELKDYCPKPEVYMANRLVTTLEQRIEIVKDCLKHGKDYKSTAAKYSCNYAQLYQWVQKYIRDGENGLTDRRGKRKQEAELTELEKAKRRIARLEREKQELFMENELLKKVRELKGRWWNINQK